MPRVDYRIDRSATGKLTPDEINGACAAVGIPNLAASLTQPHVIPTLQAQFEALLAAKG